MKRFQGSVAKALIVGSFAMLPLCFAGAARADLIFDLNVDGCSSTCGPAGTLFGTVTLSTVDPDTVHVDVDLSQTLISYFVSTGAGYALTWNGPSGETVDNMVPTTGFTFLPWLDTSVKNGGYSTGGNFGNFNYAIECDVAPKDALNPLDYCVSGAGASGTQYSNLSFDVTLAGGLTLANFTSTNPQGFFFSVDLLGPNGKTGVVGANSFTECTPGEAGCTPQECPPTQPGCTPTVPEPGTLALIGVSILAGVAVNRRRYKVRIA